VSRFFGPKLAVARATGAVSRRSGRGGGTTLPGRLLLRLAPDALGRLATSLEGGSTIVSATNGKTTTAGMIAAILHADGRVPVHNRAGSNMSWGVATALLEPPLLGARDQLRRHAESLAGWRTRDVPRRTVFDLPPVAADPLFLTEQTRRRHSPATHASRWVLRTQRPALVDVGTVALVAPGGHATASDRIAGTVLAGDRSAGRAGAVDRIGAHATGGDRDGARATTGDRTGPRATGGER